HHFLHVFDGKPPAPLSATQHLARLFDHGQDARAQQRRLVGRLPYRRAPHALAVTSRPGRHVLLYSPSTTNSAPRNSSRRRFGGLGDCSRRRIGLQGLGGVRHRRRRVRAGHVRPRSSRGTTSSGTTTSSTSSSTSTHTGGSRAYISGTSNDTATTID
ncbi:unnamed protein product, partial [Ectocarpus sp. 12 AP-2014]